jgi:hypothetical protein
MIKKVISLFIAFIFISGCEKDDICDAETTTPRIVIDFFNINNPSVPRNVTNLSIKSPDVENPYEGPFNANRIAIPLKTFTDQTVLELTNNSNSPQANTDIISINYSRDIIYISRACGFKTYFTLQPGQQGFVLTPDPNNWIQSINVVTTRIDSENEAHIQIFF